MVLVPESNNEDQSSDIPHYIATRMLTILYAYI